MTNTDRNDARNEGGRSDADRNAPLASSAPATRTDTPAGRPESTSTSTRGRDSAVGVREAKASKPIGAIIAALLAGLILGGVGASVLANASSGDPFAGVIDTGRYQAVILSNDKVYFGKISAASDDFYELDDAFFLREVRATEEAEPERALLPVNREIHAPDNTMLIRKEEVVLVENLAKDSPILTEINRQKG